MAVGQDALQATAGVLLSERLPSIPVALLLLSKPGIVLAETAAGLAGLLLACNGQLPAAGTICWTFLSLIMAASGAAMANCLLDAAADRQMSRLASRNRALYAAGNGLVMTLALLLTFTAFLVAALFLNSLTLLLLVAASVSYLLFYTLWLKRCTPWGVLVGTIPGALPPLIGAAAVSGQITTLPLMLAGVIIIWQLPHFWFLSLQYREQYRKAGFPVLPITHGIDLTKRLTLLSSVAILPAVSALSLFGHFSAGFMFVTGLTGITFSLLSYHCLYRSKAYRAGFRLSLVYLAIILVAIIVDRI